MIDPIISLQVDLIGGLLNATAHVFQWPNFLFVIGGTVIGLVFGSLPGLGAAVAIALLLPVTFDMSAGTAILIFGSALGGTAFGGSISAILINTPGTGPNAATVLDGYPLAKQGRAADAIGASATSSALGAAVGLIVLLLMIPVMLQFLLLFGAAEKFMLAIFGLSVIAIAARGSIVNGLIAGGVGLLFSFIGYNPITGVERYTLGTLYLVDGVPLVPALIGIFAVAETINLSIRQTSVVEAESVEMSGSVLRGIRAVSQHPKLFLQSAVIGLVVGAVPGVGGTVANFVSYMRASQSVSEGKFGDGDIRGVIASEAANDAKDGGALMPTLALGIPGSSAVAVLLGGLVLHGIAPGGTLFQRHVDIVFILIISLLVSNFLTSIIGISIGEQLTKVTQLEPQKIVPIILTFAFIGSFARRQLFGDVVTTLVFGILGYHMIKFKFSRVAVVIALILGNIAETNFFKTMQLGGPTAFFTQPISLMFLLITIASFVVAMRGDADMTF